MAYFRVVIRCPDPDDSTLLRSATTLYAAQGEMPAAELIDSLREACEGAKGALADGVQIEAGARFGRRGRPDEQRIYKVGMDGVDDLDDLVARVAERET